MKGCFSRAEAEFRLGYQGPSPLDSFSVSFPPLPHSLSSEEIEGTCAPAVTWLNISRWLSIPLRTKLSLAESYALSTAQPLWLPIAEGAWLGGSHQGFSRESGVTPRDCHSDPVTYTSLVAAMFSTWQMAHDSYLRNFQNLVAGLGVSLRELERLPSEASSKCTRWKKITALQITLTSVLPGELLSLEKS